MQNIILNKAVGLLDKTTSGKVQHTLQLQMIGILNLKNRFHTYRVKFCIVTAIVFCYKTKVTDFFFHSCTQLWYLCNSWQYDLTDDKKTRFIKSKLML